MNKEVIEQSKKLLKELRGWLREGRKGGMSDKNAYFGVVFRKGKTARGRGACHAALGNNYKRTYQGALSVVSLITVDRLEGRRIAKGYTTPYYRWLLNVSPWASVFITKCPKEAMKKGVILRTDVPSNLLGGALIASRYGWEGQGSGFAPKQQVYTWGQLRKRGVDESLAFLMAHQARPRNGQLFWDNTNGGHEALSLTQMSRTSVTSFLKGEVPSQRLLKETFKKCPQRYGIDAIWGKEGEEGRYLRNLLVKEAASIGHSEAKLKKRLLKATREPVRDSQVGFDHMAKWAKVWYKEFMT